MTISPKFWDGNDIANLAQLVDSSEPDDGMIGAGIVRKLLAHVLALTADRDHWREARHRAMEAGEILTAERDKLRAMERRLEEWAVQMESTGRGSVNWSIAAELRNRMKGAR